MEGLPATIPAGLGPGIPGITVGTAITVTIEIMTATIEVMTVTIAIVVIATGMVVVVAVLPLR